MISIRCSSLPLIAQCAASAQPDPVTIKWSNPIADIGSAVHEWLEQRIRGQDSDISDIATQYDIDRSELQKICSWSWSIWKELAQWFPSPQTEVELSYQDDGLLLTGHADVIQQPSVDFNRIALTDFKTGYLDLDAKDQLMGYAWLALKKYPEASLVYACIIRPRLRIVEGWEWSREEVDTWFAGIRESLTAKTIPYSPGTWCSYCPRGATCPAKTSLLRQAAVSLIGAEWPMDEAIKRNMLAKIYDAKKIISGMCDKVDELIRAEVVANGGTLEVGNGRELRMRDVTREMIDTATGLPILMSAISRDDLLTCLKVDKSRLLKHVRDKTQYGQKAHAVTELLDKLEEAGAIRQSTYQRMELHRTTDQSSQSSVTNKQTEQLTFVETSKEDGTT